MIPPSITENVMTNPVRRLFPLLAVLVSLASYSCVDRGTPSPLAPSPNDAAAGSPAARQSADLQVRGAVDAADQLDISDVELAAGTCTITGYVADSKLPSSRIAGVTIVFRLTSGKGLSHSTKTDSKGNFKITLPCGKYVATVTVDGKATALSVDATKSRTGVKLLVTAPTVKCDPKAWGGAYNKCTAKYGPYTSGELLCLKRADKWYFGGCKGTFVP